MQVLSYQHFTVTLILTRHSKKDLPPQPSVVFISGSNDWDEEEDETGEALYTEVDPGVEVAGIQFDLWVQRQGWACLLVACTLEKCWRMGEEWMEEGAALKSGKGANGRGGCRLTGGAGNCGAKCRRALKDGCRWDSEKQGRICFG